MKCIKCGAELPDGEQLCQFCGAKQETQTSEGNENKNHALGDKAVYLIGAVLGIVIVIIIILVRSGGSTSDDSVSGVLAETDVPETVAAPSEWEDAVSTNKAETAVLEETESETETVTEAAAPEPIEMLTARLVKGDGYENEFDEDGDLVSHRWYNPENPDYNYGQITYQYLTDANGNKVSATEMYRYWTKGIDGLYDLAIHHLLQSVDWNNVYDGDSYTYHAEFVYDEKNRLLEWQSSSSSGQKKYVHLLMRIMKITQFYQQHTKQRIGMR